MYASVLQASREGTYDYGIAVYHILSNQTTVVGVSASKAACLLFANWQNRTKYELYDVFIVSDMNQIQENMGAPLLSLPYLDNTAMFMSYLRNYSLFGAAYAYDQCFADAEGKQYCKVFVPFIAPLLDSFGKIYSFSVTVFSASLGADLNKKVEKIPGAVAYIMDKQSGNLISTSDSTVIIKVDGSAVSMMKASEHTNPLVYETANHIFDTFGSNFEHYDPESTPLYKFHFSSSKESSTVACSITYYSAAPGQEWIIVLAYPQRLFLGRYIAGVTSTIIVSVLIALAGLGLGLLAAIFIVKPINKVVKQMNYLETMQLDLVEASSLSTYTEIASIQRTFYTVVDRLKEYRAFLPSYVLERDFGKDLDIESEKPDIPVLVLKEQTTTNNITNNTNEIVPQTVRTARRDTETDSTMSRNSSVFANKLSLGLNPSDSCILTAKIPHFKALLQQNSLPEIVKLHGEILEIIEKCAKRTAGTLIGFNQSKYTIHWTGNKNTSNLACQSAMAILDAIRGREKHNEHFKIMMSISDNHSMYGNMGTKTRRQFLVFGDAKSICSSICDKNEEWGTKVLVDENVVKKTKNQYVYRPVFSLSEQSTVIYELVSKKENKSDEWMYEMEAQKGDSRYDLYEKGFVALQNGDNNAAIQYFNEYLDEYPNDAMAIKWLNIANANNK
jgi:class 3 adenylate cyclase